MEFYVFANILLPFFPDSKDNGQFVRELLGSISLVSFDEIEEELNDEGRTGSTLSGYIASRNPRALPKKLAAKIFENCGEGLFIEFIEDNLNPIQIKKFQSEMSEHMCSDTTLSLQEIEEIYINILYEASKESTNSAELKKATQKYQNDLVVQAESICPNQFCNNPLKTTNKDGTYTDNFEIVVIDTSKKITFQNMIALCPQCAKKYNQNTDYKVLNNLKLIKKNIVMNQSIKEQLKDGCFDEEIIKILEEISNLDLELNNQTNFKPKDLQVKLEGSSKLLIFKNISYNTEYFYRVNDIFKELDTAGVVNFEKIRMGIITNYISIKNKCKSKDDIYDKLVDNYVNITKSERAYCEIVVSYFIQKCDIFNEISQ